MYFLKRLLASPAGAFTLYGNIKPCDLTSGI